MPEPTTVTAVETPTTAADWCALAQDYRRECEAAYRELVKLRRRNKEQSDLIRDLTFSRPGKPDAKCSCECCRSWGSAVVDLGEQLTSDAIRVEQRAAQCSDERRWDLEAEAKALRRAAQRAYGVAGEE